jgi:hypothetical protein
MSWPGNRSCGPARFPDNGSEALPGPSDLRNPRNGGRSAGSLEGPGSP